MPTLMTRPSFERLAQVRTQLIDQGFAPATPGRAGVAGLFLPWAGRRLAEAGGNIHYERFAEQVLGGLLYGRPFAQTPADQRRIFRQLDFLFAADFFELF